MTDSLRLRIFDAIIKRHPTSMDWDVMHFVEALISHVDIRHPDTILILPANFQHTGIFYFKDPVTGLYFRWQYTKATSGIDYMGSGLK